MYEYQEIADERRKTFDEMSEVQKDAMTCDEVFCMYLRDVSKNINENCYKQCLRFILMYRECINEFGWLKRSETYARAGMLHEDSLLRKLKVQEEELERAAKEEDEENSEEKADAD